MYQNASLQSYIEESSSINIKSIVLAEWNMNFSDNVVTLGNYRYRPGISSPTEVNFGIVNLVWVEETSLTASPTYFGATNSNIVLNTGINLTTMEPTIASSLDQTEKMLYSLTETISRFRPRSGINKIRYFEDNFLNFSNSNMHQKPRYYLSSKDDKFKYWNSFRKETVGTAETQRGIATVATGNGDFFIDDVAPFVVYSNPVPANRIVVKMQTQVGDVDGGSYKIDNTTSFNDPFYELATNTGNLINQQTPAVWSVQYLNASNSWTTAKSFSLNELRANGKRVIGSDGYVELAYGITNAPAVFNLLGERGSSAALPLSVALGDAYLVPGDTSAQGTVYVWNGTNWTTNKFTPSYGWYLNEESLDTKASNIKDLTSPKFYGSATTIYTPTYREFQFVKGIRIVVNTMTRQGSSFDLIEMSPRLVADLSDKTTSFSVEKIASDIGNTGIPVGELLASTGSISLFDYDQSFNEYNDLTVVAGIVSGSLISNISSRHLQFKFYEQITDDRNFPAVVSYFVPIKTMYVDGFPQVSTADRMVTLSLRDLLFYFESTIAPSLLLRNASLSYAIATLLDNVGFSNYKFYRNAEESEDLIPYFFIAPDTTVAEVLSDLAKSTQTAMFFDEDNNFISMSRNYIMPTVAERATNITLYGTKDFEKNGTFKNKSTNSKLSNIISLDAEDNVIYNGGKVTYSNKYIQKSYSTIQEAGMVNRGQAYKYKPVLLWEVSGTELLRPTNDEVGNQSAYSLSALALNSPLSNSLPTVVLGSMINNIMDFGQSIYWLSRYQGYFYANSEIIKYDAVQYSVTGSGLVWIEDVKDYQKYFATLPFKGKMFPTGRVRIYAEPTYNSSGQVVNGLAAKHGRGQFGTQVVSHTVLDSTSYWLNTDYHKTFKMQSRWIFKENANYNHQYQETLYQTTTTASASSGATTLFLASVDGLKEGLSFYEYKDKAIGAQAPSIALRFVTLTLNSHGFVPGNQVKIANLVPAKYNGIYTLTATTSNTFTFENKHSASGNITIGGTIAPLFNTRSISSSAIPVGTKIKSIATSTKTVTLTKALTGTVASGSTIYLTNNMVEPLSNRDFNATTDSIPFLSEKPTVLGTTKDFFDTSSYTESSNTATIDKTKPNAVIKSSALSIQGPASFSSSSAVKTSNDVISYVYKPYSSQCPNPYSFGARVRVIGNPLPTTGQINEAKQSPIGGEILETYTNSNGNYSIAGTGGGIAFNLGVSANKNIGYYFEILALSNEAIQDSLDSTTNSVVTVPNVYFYKVLKGANSKEAVPVVLWNGNASILVDDGQFVGMSKSMSTKTSTVYDLLVETEDLGGQEGAYRRKFYLYLNGTLIASVQDDDAIPVTDDNKNFALFTRGKGLCLFEHAFMIGDNSKNVVSPEFKNPIFNNEKIDNSNYRKYLINPAILKTYLKELGSNQQPAYSLYFEEFGTIMRECAYFNIRYDKAYPALYSRISPTLNDSQGYVISNFRSNPYGAEFMIFNATDFALNLDESTGNYLRIQGVTFTQQSAHDLTVDEYFQKTSDLNNYENFTSLNNKYYSIQNSRNTYGKKDFTISGSYIQNIDTANSLMKWMVDKIMQPKKSVGLSIFANPMIQLGDIVTIDYNIDGVLQNSDARFVVYHINYDRNSDGPEMKLYLSEVV